MIRLRTEYYLFFSTRRFKVKKWVSDLEFAIDNSWSGCLFHLSIMSCVAYFNIQVWPCHVAMYRYGNVISVR
jgi:hypothetical protein